MNIKYTLNNTKSFCKSPKSIIKVVCLCIYHAQDKVLSTLPVFYSD